MFYFKLYSSSSLTTSFLLASFLTTEANSATVSSGFLALRDSIKALDGPPQCFSKTETIWQ